VYVYGTYPDLEGLFQEQAVDNDAKRREATLQRIQQLVHERVVYSPIWQLGFINGVGPRVQESGLGLIGGHAYSAPLRGRDAEVALVGDARASGANGAPRAEPWAAADKNEEPAKSVRRARSPASADRSGSSVRTLRAATVEDTSTPVTYQAKARRVAGVFPQMLAIEEAPGGDHRLLGAGGRARRAGLCTMRASVAMARCAPRRPSDQHRSTSSPIEAPR